MRQLFLVEWYPDKLNMKIEEVRNQLIKFRVF